MNRIGLLRVVLAFSVATTLCTAPGARADAPLIAAAGDIACPPGAPVTKASCRQAATAKLLSTASAVLPLGDLQYHRGTLFEFRHAYARNWGAYAPISRPVAGNHEYETPGASGYFRYWVSRAGDPRRGYYAWNLGTWHLIALNANCVEVGGCGVNSRQGRWLVHNLEANTRRCVLAYWHQPRFSSGRHGNDPTVDGFWRLLYRFRADIVLNGHDHIYERFALQTPRGASSRSGIREFIVGTGGRSHSKFGHVHRHSVVRNATTFGVLRLRLRSTSYHWRFAPIAGSAFTDSGSHSCH